MSHERLLLLLLCACSCVTSTGCQAFWPFKSRQPEFESPVAFTARPSQQQLIQTVNSNSSKVQQLQSQVKLTVEGLPGLTGDLALEKPNRFRLNASLLGVGGNGVDVGSNDELFWLWFKSPLPGQKPEILYARHSEFAQSPLKQQIPIDPSWVRDALGLTEINPNLPHDGPFERTNGDLELRTTLETNQGRMTRLTVIDPKYGWVKEQSLLNSRLQILLMARSSRFQYYQEVDVSLPQRIEIELLPGTAEAQKLTLDATRFQLNQLNGEPAQLWTMPNQSGVEARNLLAGMPAPPPNIGPTGQAPISQTSYGMIGPDPRIGAQVRQAYQPDDLSAPFAAQPMTAPNAYGNDRIRSADHRFLSEGTAHSSQFNNGRSLGESPAFNPDDSRPGIDRPNGQRGPTTELGVPGSYRSEEPYQQNYRGQTYR